MPIYCHFESLVAKINGREFLNLNESRLEQFGVSLGFQCTLMDIIENLVCDIQYHKKKSDYVKQYDLLA